MLTAPPAFVALGAVTRIPAESDLRWAASCPDGDPNMELDEIRPDRRAYLIPATDAKPKRYLRDSYKLMLTERLFSRRTDESFWPDGLLFQTFQALFEHRPRPSPALLPIGQPGILLIITHRFASWKCLRREQIYVSH